MAEAEVQWPPRNSTAEQIVAGMDLSDRHFLITGANTGIGLETARVLAGRGAFVTMACRNMDKAAAARASILAEFPDAKVEPMRLDLADLSSVEAFAEAYKATGRPLHVLLLNAGLYAAPELHTKDGLETTFQVNHVGQMYLAELLLPRLKASRPSRVVVVSSMAHKGAPGWAPAHFLQRDLLSPADPSGWIQPMRIYCFTKLCNILFAGEFDRRYAEDGVRAFSLHPGIIDTEFGRNSNFVTLSSATATYFLKRRVRVLDLPKDVTAAEVVGFLQDRRDADDQPILLDSTLSPNSVLRSPYLVQPTVMNIVFTISELHARVLATSKTSQGNGKKKVKTDSFSAVIGDKRVYGSNRHQPNKSALGKVQLNALQSLIDSVRDEL